MKMRKVKFDSRISFVFVFAFAFAFSKSRQGKARQDRLKDIDRPGSQF
jgi:hypothetical protein